MSTAESYDWRLVARDEQENYCRCLGNRLFDEYPREKPYKYLQTKVGFAMLGPPPSLEAEERRTTDDKTDQCSLGALLWPKRDRKFIMSLTKFIVQCIDRLDQGAKDPLKVAFIFVTGNTLHKKAIRYSQPVIRIHVGHKICFVDTSRRHYKDWSDYLANNTLPPSCFMYPEGGIYRVDEFGMVVLGEGRTPAGLRKRRVLNAADQLGVWLGLGSAVAGVAACPPLAVGAAALGISTVVWASVRSVAGLLDKRKHRQSISPLDSAARADWLMIAGGVVGIASSAAVAYVRFAATTTAVQCANITLSGLTAVDSGYRYFSKNGPREPLEFLQFGVAVFFFTNSIVNSTFMTPPEIISESPDLYLRWYDCGLNGHQKEKIAGWINGASRNSNPTSAKAKLIRRNNVGANFGHLFTGQVPEEEATMEADGDLVGRFPAAGARLLACPSLSLSDMPHYRIGEEEAHFTLGWDRAAELGLAGFKVFFSQGEQIDSPATELPPTQSEPPNHSLIVSIVNYKHKVRKCLKKQ